MDLKTKKRIWIIPAVILISAVSIAPLIRIQRAKWAEKAKAIREEEQRKKVQTYLEGLKEGFAPWDQPAEVFLKAIQTNFLGIDVRVISNQIVPKYHFWLVAKTNKIHIDCLIACNPFLTSFHARLGQIVYTPLEENGAFHYVQTNEDLAILSALYNVEKEKILARNKIGEEGVIPPGAVIYIPGGRPKVLTKKMRSLFMKRKIFRVPTDGWVRGRGFGYKMHPIFKEIKFHKGIDMKAEEGTLIFAARSGVVTMAGKANGYGKLVIIKHDQGFETYYAHLSKILVRPGQKVKRRKVIGRVGSSGYSTTPHLHFEVRKHGKPVDPLKYLW